MDLTAITTLVLQCRSRWKDSSNTSTSRITQRSVEEFDMGRQTKLTASQHAEIRAAAKEREELLDGARRFRQAAKRAQQRADRLSRKALSHRYGVNPRTIDRVLRGEPYGSVKPEPASTRS
jgi:ribosome-binding protein aMBF1 (putative translation factor)